MENYDSFLPDEMLNKLNRSLDTFYLKIREIIENKSLASQQKEAEIKKRKQDIFYTHQCLLNQGILMKS